MAMIKEALYFDQLDQGVVRCRLCPAECRLSEGKYGLCQSRKNHLGQLVTENYGELVTLALDPIEKKPLYHFYPGSMILSTGANGCNLKCENCQNWSISQQKAKTNYCSPEQLVAAALANDSIGVAFTYTEPFIWYEYILDTAPLLREAGLKTVLVSNGYINREPLEKIIEYIDAINVDLKGIQAEFYKKICHGQIEPILENLKLISQSDTHLEITNLIIPELNDSEEDINRLVDFIASLSDAIPLHFSAYHPDFKMNQPATPEQTLLKAKNIAIKKLKFVYLGNIMISGMSDTICPGCNTVLIERNGFSPKIFGLEQGKCSDCGFLTGIVQND